MKRLAIAALAVSLIGGAASAEPWQHNNANGGNHNSNAGNGGNHQNFSHNAPGNFHGNPGAFQRGPGNFNGGNRFQGNAGYQNRHQGGSAQFQAHDNFRGQNNYQTAPAYRGGPGQAYNRGGYDRGAYNGYRNDRGFESARGGHWGGPHDSWGYHGWGYGGFIPRGFLVDSFFLDDYADYDLGAPPPNCEWVQDGPNALLVDIYTGQVIQVVPNAFGY
jgi:Ni/Co efflux regulator RcnB